MLFEVFCFWIFGAPPVGGASSYLLIILNFSLFILARSTREGCFFLRHQKETKKCFSIGWKLQFRAFTGMPLMQRSRWGNVCQGEKVYIETPDTAVDGGGSFVCAGGG
jgi:hypothetical protein